MWWRRLVYAVTLVLTAVLVSYPWTGGYLGKAVPALIGLVDPNLAYRLTNLAGTADVGSRGFISPLVDVVAGFLPAYATRWTNAFLEYPIEFGSLAIAVVLCLYASTVLQKRIHDRARLAWHAQLLPQYRLWMGDRRTGVCRAMIVALVAAVVLLIAVVKWGAPPLTQIELGALVVILAGAFVWQRLDARRLSPGATSPELRSTTALSIARALRTNTCLVLLYRALFKVVVPVAFALGLVIAALTLANRILFDGWSAAGQVCPDGMAKKDLPKEKLGTSSASFTTKSMC